jgi:hypothetical protein
MATALSFLPRMHDVNGAFRWFSVFSAGTSDQVGGRLIRAKNEAYELRPRG